MWPPSFALARAYLDQLERSKGLPADAIASARTALTNAERRAGATSARRADAARDAAEHRRRVRRAIRRRCKMLATAVTDLANGR